MLNMRPSLASILLVCLLNFFCLPDAFALPEDDKQPAELEANQIDFDSLKHLGIYRGQVHFVKGSQHLDADEVQTQFDDHNQITYAIATAQDANLAHFWAKMKPEDPEVHAYAKKIEYFPNKHLLILQDDASVIQGENQMHAPVIEYDMETRHVITRALNGLRTRLIIHSDKQKT